MDPKIVIVGAGAVGGYVGGHLARAGRQVVLIDPWGEHIEFIRQNGIVFVQPEAEYAVRVPTLHVHEVQGLFRAPADLAFIATKSYDTAWATALIKPYLKPGGFVVSLQNSINEARIARVVGWGKTVGCVVSGISVNAFKPGHIRRTVLPGGKPHTVFRAGEVHGRITPRVEALAELLEAVDRSQVTTNLWGQRWSKLVINAMGNPVAAVTGLNSRQIAERQAPRRLSIRLGCEAVRVGQALGYCLEPLRGITPERLLAAGQGDAEALAEVENSMIAKAQRRTAQGIPSTAQDIQKGRRTEIDFLNGLIAAEGKALGIPTPSNEGIAALVRQIECREIQPAPEHIDRLANP